MSPSLVTSSEEALTSGSLVRSEDASTSGSLVRSEDGSTSGSLLEQLNTMIPIPRMTTAARTRRNVSALGPVVSLTPRAGERGQTETPRAVPIR